LYKKLSNIVFLQIRTESGAHIFTDDHSAHNFFAWLIANEMRVRGSIF
jgi:hypothetical protein